MHWVGGRSAPLSAVAIVKGIDNPAGTMAIVFDADCAKCHSDQLYQTFEIQTLWVAQCSFEAIAEYAREDSLCQSCLLGGLQCVELSD
jgi:hypothetical protein